MNGNEDHLRKGDCIQLHKQELHLLHAMKLWLPHFALPTSLMIVGSFSFTPLHVRRNTRTVIHVNENRAEGGDLNIDNEKEDESLSPHKVAIQQALEASRKYGPTSPEARVARGVAEEIEDSIFSPCSKRYVLYLFFWADFA